MTDDCHLIGSLNSAFRWILVFLIVLESSTFVASQSCPPAPACNCAPVISLTCSSPTPETTPPSSCSSPPPPPTHPFTTEPNNPTTTRMATNGESTSEPTASTSQEDSTATTPFSNSDCQHVLSSDSGWFTSPNHPNNYPDSASCTWLVDATGPISISFSQFILESNWDFVRVYDGPTAESALILQATGFSIPSAIVSSSRQVLVTFTADISVTFSGFNATYSLSGATTAFPTTAEETSPSTPFSNNSNCMYVLSSDSGWFTSPNHPNNYPDNARCNWLINATGPVIISFSQFILESNFDYVRVYDGPTAESALILQVTGTWAIPSPAISSSGQVFVTFTTDGSVTFSGFYARYSLYDEETTPTSTPTTNNWSSSDSNDPTSPFLDNCQIVLQETSGYFTSPFFPNNYPNNANCSWLITVPSGQRIDLRFNEIQTEYNFDFIKVYDGPLVFTSYQLFVANGNYGPQTMTSSGNQLLITFTSDGSVTSTGFSANYSLSTASTSTPISECGGNINANSGSIVSPNFPNGYPANSQCTWRITSDPGTRILFHFTDFSTYYWDYVNVYDGPYVHNWFSVISQSGNVSSPCSFLSNSNTILVTFSSGSNSPSYAGFRANFTTNHGCGVNYISNSQATNVIETPGYPINGSTAYSNCIWRIRVAVGSRVNLTLTDLFDSYHHHISIYEGNNTNEYGEDNKLLASTDRVSSSPSPFYVISKSNEMTVVTSTYISSACSTYNNKLRFTYAPTTSPKYGCYGTMNTNTKVITSPGYPNEYSPRSLICQWKNSEPSGSKIRISFSNPINISAYGGDSLSIYNGPSLDYTQIIYEVSSIARPLPVTTQSNETLIRFSTGPYIDNPALYSGWSAALRRV